MEFLSEAVKLPVPRQTLPEEVFVVQAEVTENEAQLLLLPYPAALERILDETFSPMGWACRRYNCGGTLYCSVGVYNPMTNDYVHKDAPATQDYKGKDKVRAADTSCFWGAAAHWGVCSDIRALPMITMRKPDVDIVPVAGGRDGKQVTGYRVNQRLRVDKFSRREDGSINMVQLIDQHGKKILWEAG